MDTLVVTLSKFNLSFNKGQLNPVEIPNVGRNTLVEWLNELDFKVGIEIGVAEGEYSEIICKANPQMKVYGIDPWAPYKGYRDYTRTSTFSRMYDKTIDRMSRYPNYKIIKEFSIDGLKMFEDNSIDFVYIDGNHSEPFVSQDIREWYKKVRPGGILAGHDYARIKGRIEGKLIDTNWQVKDAIQKFTKDNKICPWFVLGSEAKVPGTVRDDIRSWMIVKQ